MPQGYDAFVPDALPRHIELSPELTMLLSEADRALGQLGGMASTLPNVELLTAPLSSREAVLSSRIEGTLATLSDLALFDAGAGDSDIIKLPGDVLEVHNYRAAMSYGMQRIEQLPMSLRLVRELHERLMAGVRGQELTPGAFRTSQNWIGAPGATLSGATYVPPPPQEMMACLSDWEKLFHDGNVMLPPLVLCAVMHYQFEAIHPFLDGNGRVGRLLIVLTLCGAGHLPGPVLYLGPYIERHRQTYYDLLRAVTERSAWAEWLGFFLQGIVEQCHDSVVRSQRLLRLYESYRAILINARAAPAVHRLLDVVFRQPAVSAAYAAEQMEMTTMSASRSIAALADHGILQEMTGKRRGRMFMAKGVLDAIESDI